MQTSPAQQPHGCTVIVQKLFCALTENFYLQPFIEVFFRNLFQIEVPDIAKDNCDYERLLVLCNINHLSMGIQPEYDFPVHVRSN